MKFKTHSHKNILGTHNTTLEFTKDSNLTLNGSCIIGISSDFNLEELKQEIKGKNKLKVIIRLDNLSDEINAIINPDFDDDKEIVIRLGEFASKRTLGIRADKACVHLNRELINKMKEEGRVMDVEMIAE